MPIPQPRPSIPTIGFPSLVKGHAALHLALQFQLDRTQWWPADVLADHQRKQLRLLLDHAARTAPYYRSRFAESGFTVPEELDEESWLKVPVSRRRDLQEAGESFFSEAPPASHGGSSKSTTSGSTGQPLTFARNAVTVEFWRAFVLRDLIWHDQDLSEHVAAIRYAPVGIGEPPEGILSPHWNNTVALVFRTGSASMLNVSTGMDGQLDWLEKRRPDRLVTFPSNLRALIDHARRTGRALPPLRSIRTVGEMLTAEDRQFIGSAWGAKVTDMYSCEEAGYLALECPEYGHYHVQSENVRLEILDEEDRPCPPGVPGRVVISSLCNFTSPMVRMDLGDMAELGPPCPCGRGLPVIARILGRTRNRLVLPNGEKRYPRVGEKSIIDAAPGATVRRFKVIQHDLETVEVQIAASRPFTQQEQDALALKVQENLGHPFRIVFAFPEDIPPNPNGKRETFISHVDA